MAFSSSYLVWLMLLALGLCHVELAEAQGHDDDDGLNDDDDDDESHFLSSYACQDEMLHIDCKSGQKLQIIRANFGRFSIAICNAERRTDLSVNCVSPVTLGTLQRNCGSSSCSILATDKLFGSRDDACFETSKYLEVHYRCTDIHSDDAFGNRERSPSSSSWTPSSSDWSTSPSSSRGIQSNISGTNSNVNHKKRIPITSEPKTMTPSSIIITPMNTISSVKTKDITTKFLGSSVASTNIMDTSEVPITLLTTSDESTNPPNSSVVQILMSSSTPDDDEEVTTSSSSITTTQAYFAYDDHDEEAPGSWAMPNVTHNESAAFEVQRGRFCSESHVKGLRWARTLTGTTATAPCPGQATGKVSWKCTANGTWISPLPDLSGCVSVWLMNISKKLNGQDSIVQLVNDLEHFSTLNPLYGGDLLALMEAVERMTVRIRIDLEQIPSLKQRRAVVTEVIQKVMKLASTMISKRNANSWQDLGGRLQRNQAITRLINVLENVGLLLPEVTGENEEVTLTSENILVSVKKLNFRHMSHIKFPSAAGLNEWSGYFDYVEIPSLVLMEHMQRGRGVTEVIFISCKNLLDILNPQKSTHSRSPEVLETPLVSLSMGKRVSSLKLPGFLSAVPLVRAISEERLEEPVTVLFQHATRERPSGPGDQSRRFECVHWDVKQHNWTANGCSLIDWNSTHVRCECSRMSTFALIRMPSSANEATPWKNSELPPQNVLIWIFSSVMVICLLIILMVLAYAFCVYCRSHVQPGETHHKRLQASPTSSQRTIQSQQWHRSSSGLGNLIKRLGACCTASFRPARPMGTHRLNDVSFGWTTDMDIQQSGGAAAGNMASSPTFRRADGGRQSAESASDLKMWHTQMNSSNRVPNIMTLNMQSDSYWDPRPRTTRPGLMTLTLIGHGQRSSGRRLQNRPNVSSPERPLLHQQGDAHPALCPDSQIYMEVHEWPEPIQRPLLDASRNGLYDNVRGEERGPFVRYEAACEDSFSHHPTSPLV